MGGMAIGKSQPCCAWKAGVSITRRSSAYGTKKVYSCRAGTRSANGFIIKTAPSSGYGPHTPNHIWAIDFVHDKLSNGRSYKMLTVLDEYTREALCVAVRPKMNAHDVLETLHPLLMKHGKPEFIRSDNGPEFIATHLQDWLKKVGIKPMQIYPGSPWENGYNERFNGTLRKEVLNAEWFHTTRQAQVAINVWLRQYNQIRPHHALNMRPPVPETLLEKPKINGRI